MGVLDLVEQKAYSMSPFRHIRNMQSKRSIAKQKKKRLQSDISDREVRGILEDSEQEAREEQADEQDDSARSRDRSTSTSTSTNTSDSNSNSNGNSINIRSSNVDVRRDNVMVNNGPRNATTRSTAVAHGQSPARTFEIVRGYHVGSGRVVNWTGGDDSLETPAAQQGETSKIPKTKAGSMQAGSVIQDDKPQPTAGSTSETAANQQKSARRRSFEEWNIDSDFSWPSERSDYLGGANTCPRAQRFLAAYYARQQQQQQEREQQEQQEEQQQQKQQQEGQETHEKRKKTKQLPGRRSRFVESFEHTAAETIARHNGDWPISAWGAQATSTISSTDNGQGPACSRREVKAKMESIVTKLLSRVMLPCKDGKDGKDKRQKGKGVTRSGFKENGKEERAAEVARLIMGGATM